MKFPLFARNGPCLARILVILLESHKFLHNSHDLTLDSHEFLYHSHEIFSTPDFPLKRGKYIVLTSKKAGKQPASLTNNYFFKL